jgi:methyl-accepting chemotaxis protein-1 (serine sensor receptor)
MKSMKLRTALPLSIITLLALMAVAAAIGISQLRDAVGAFDGQVRNTVDVERRILGIEILFKGQVQEWKDTLLRGKDPAKLEKYWGAFQAKEARVQELTKSLAASVGDPDVRRGLLDFAAAHEEMGRRYREGFKAFQAAGFEPAAGDAAVAGMDRAPTARLNDIAALIAGRSAAASEAATASGHRAAVASVVLMAGVSLCGLALSLLLTRAVVRLLGGEPAEAARAARAIAHGDLSTRLPVKPGDARSLLFSLAQMQESLRTLVARVQENADAVAAASSEMALGNTQLASSTQEQAAALEQTLSSLQDLNLHVARNAEHAAQAHALATGAAEVAQRGAEVVLQLVHTMKEIDASSRRIGEITEVVDSIAYQTNILALNASVEAARAGEQGRGFAVVATEVRTLAQRSANAARQIKELLGTSVARAKQGAELADKAGETMKGVNQAVAHVTVITGEISEANQAQSEGVARLTSSMHTIEAGTQQNASMVEEIAASSENLRSLSFELFTLVSSFKVSDEQPSRARSAQVIPLHPAEAAAQG